MFAGSMTLRHARPADRSLLEVGWYVLPKIHGSAAGPTSIHQIEQIDPDHVERLLSVRHQFAWDLVLAAEA